MSLKKESIKSACQIISNIFGKLKDFIKPGMSTYEVDQFCNKEIELSGAKSAAYKYPGVYQPFPMYTCISINNEVCHGIPNKFTILKKGDIVSVDICVKYKEYHGDSCITFILEEPLHKEHLELVKASYKVMRKAIEAIKPGVSIGTLGYIMENTAHSLQYNVIEDFCGHGIGRKLHEAPQVPFYGIRNTGYVLKEGDCITIEPMITKGDNEVAILEDGWTAVTKNLSAQFEHCVYVTKDGYEVLSTNFIDNTQQFVI